MGGEEAIVGGKEVSRPGIESFGDGAVTGEATWDAGELLDSTEG